MPEYLALYGILSPLLSADFLSVGVRSMHLSTVKGVPASNCIASSNVLLKQTGTRAAESEKSLPISLEVVDHPGAA